MIGCSRISSRLSAYADGELNTTQAQAVEEHLGRCKRCEGELQGLQRLQRTLLSLPEEEVPGDLHGRIMMRLAYADAAPAPAAVVMRPRVNPWMMTALGGAVAALALGVVVLRQEGLHQDELPVVHARSADDTPAPAQPQPRENRMESPSPEAERPEPVRAVEATTEHVPAARTPPSRDAGVREPVMVASPQPAAQPARSGSNVAAAPKPKTGPPAREVRPRAANPGAGDRSPVETRPVEPEPVVPPAPPVPSGPGVIMAATPGEAVVTPATGNGQPEPVTTAIEKDPTRMAGMTIEAPAPGEEDEGLRQLRMFFEERSRSIPQPPLLRGDRRMRKL